MKDKELTQMFNEINSSKNKMTKPSKCWEDMNNQYLGWLNSEGFENFKQTLNFHYFAFFYKPNSPAYDGLKSNLPFTTWAKVSLKIAKKHGILSWPRSLSYNLTTGLLWEYDKRNYPSTCKEIEEPEVGNPPRLYEDGKLISQDLANSIIEYSSMKEGAKSIPKHIMELGGGYGRTAYVFLRLNPNIRYILVDIPPSLWIAQKYLSEVFPDLKVFKFRHFKSYKEVKAELESSNIIFLTPNQMEMLPDKSADLFINIASLQEMRMDQIRYYFKQINRLTKKFFYFKEFKVSEVPNENIIIREADYPIPKRWKRIYRKECIYPSTFFEAMYHVI